MNKIDWGFKNVQEIMEYYNIPLVDITQISLSNKKGYVSTILLETSLDDIIYCSYVSKKSFDSKFLFPKNYKKISVEDKLKYTFPDDVFKKLFFEDEYHTIANSISFDSLYEYNKDIFDIDVTIMKTFITCYYSSEYRDDIILMVDELPQTT